MSHLASIPSALRWFENTYGRHTPAALIHDNLIRPKPRRPAPERPGVGTCLPVHAAGGRRPVLQALDRGRPSPTPAPGGRSAASAALLSRSGSSWPPPASPSPGHRGPRHWWRRRGGLGGPCSTSRSPGRSSPGAGSASGRGHRGGGRRAVCTPPVLAAVGYALYWLLEQGGSGAPHPLRPAPGQEPRLRRGWPAAAGAHRFSGSTAPSRSPAAGADAVDEPPNGSTAALDVRPTAIALREDVDSPRDHQADIASNQPDRRGTAIADLAHGN